MINAKARLRPDMFSLCEETLLFDDGHMKTWSGGKNNPWVDCSVGSEFHVWLGGHKYRSSQIDWEVRSKDGKISACLHKKLRNRMEKERDNEK